jgi:hypothetical protein
LKHPEPIRQRALKCVSTMLKEIHQWVACYGADDTDVLRQLENPQQFDLAVDVTNFVMERLGQKAPAPKEPRFDKTRRALAKKSPRRGRGVLKAADVAALNGEEPSGAE